MRNCIDIFNNNKGESTFGASIYIDPLGYEYPKSVVVCSDCIFNFGHDSCVLYKEAGLDDNEVHDKLRRVQRESECPYFLIKDFSEGGDEDEIARNEVKEISMRLNYPKEYWSRSNIHAIMEQKEIGYKLFEGESCNTCEHCDANNSSIARCNFHDIDLFAEDRYCEQYRIKNEDEKGSKEILITAALYSKGPSVIPICDKYSLKSNPDHTFYIVSSIDSRNLICLEPYLLTSVRYNKNDGCVYAKYVHKIDVFDPDNQVVVKTISDDDDEEEGRTWLNSVSESVWFEEIDNVKLKQLASGVTEGDRMRKCERCENVNRNNSYPHGSPTGLICTLKSIFVTANGVCSDFSR